MEFIILTTYENHRLNLDEHEVETRLPNVNYLRSNNAKLSAEETATDIHEWMKQIRS